MISPTATRLVEELGAAKAATPKVDSSHHPLLVETCSTLRNIRRNVINNPQDRVVKAAMQGAGIFYGSEDSWVITMACGLLMGMAIYPNDCQGMYGIKPGELTEADYKVLVKAQSVVLKHVAQRPAAPKAGKPSAIQIIYGALQNLG